MVRSQWLQCITAIPVSPPCITADRLIHHQMYGFSFNAFAKVSQSQLSICKLSFHSPSHSISTQYWQCWVFAAMIHTGRNSVPPLFWRQTFIKFKQNTFSSVKQRTIHSPSNRNDQSVSKWAHVLAPVCFISGKSSNIRRRADSPIWKGLKRASGRNNKRPISVSIPHDSDSFEVLCLIE